jgi:hypothetical protein
MIIINKYFNMFKINYFTFVYVNLCTSDIDLHYSAHYLQGFL